MLRFIGDQETSATYIFKASSWESLAAPQWPCFNGILKKYVNESIKIYRKARTGKITLRNSLTTEKTIPITSAVVRSAVYKIYSYFRIACHLSSVASELPGKQ